MSSREIIKQKIQAKRALMELHKNSIDIAHKGMMNRSYFKNGRQTEFSNSFQLKSTIKSTITRTSGYSSDAAITRANAW